MVRFSTEMRWPSFSSETCSVGTTTWRTRWRWPMVAMRCSRLCLTLFSCPEEVLMTYQRNMEIAFSEGSGSWCWGSNAPLDGPVENGVPRSEVGVGDRDEDHR